jgi:hypothetical protein
MIGTSGTGVAGWARGHGLAVKVVALSACVLVGLATRLPTVTAADRGRIAGRFGFQRSYLDGDPAGARSIRQVEPRLARYAAWISAVGASVALQDLDGNGLPDDRCLVDPRDDSVTVAPVPGTGARYTALALRPQPLPFDARTTAPMGCVTGDYNQDGSTDALVFYWGRSPVLFLRRAGAPLGAGASAFAPVDLVSPPQVWNTETVDVADVDGDGHADLVVGNYFPDGARLLDPSAASDPAMRMNDSLSNAGNGGRNRVLLWRAGRAGAEPSASFAEASGALPDRVARSWTLAIGAQDLDGDGLPELYFANDFGPDQLLVNHSRPGMVRFSQARGARSVAVPKSKVLGDDSFKGMGVAFTDLNHDATPDILVSNITSPYALEESNFAFVSQGSEGTVADRLASGSAPYRDRSEDLGLSRAGWAWDVKVGDFDNSGDAEVVQAVGFLRGRTDRWPQLQELAMGNDAALQDPGLWPRFQPGDDLSGHDRNPFFAPDGHGRFVDVAGALGLDNPGVSRGIALADVDGDGRLDFAVANQWARSTFFHNTGPTHGFLGLRLRVPASATGAERGATLPAVGAEVTVTPAGGASQRDQLYPANGHTGVSSADLEFGLGAATGPVDVQVRWRDASGAHTASTSLTAGWHTLLLNRSGVRAMP